MARRPATPRWLCGWLLCLLPGLVLAQQPLRVLSIDGAISPATADYVVRGLDDARGKAQAVVLRIDTPGGLDKAMRDIVRAIVNSPLPVIGYVAPSGARAASAGTYILYASHVAAMSPATNLGAATPVAMGAPGLTPSGDEKSEPDPSSAMEKKIVNDAIAYLRGLAELRGRNADWAEQAVREGVSLSASEALEQNVIDLIATDLDDLKRQLHQRTVKLGDDSVTLDSATAELQAIEPDWRSAFLAVIANPNIAYILLLIGIYGLVFEFSNPGMGVPGVVGAICLLLALYAMQLLPISYSGLGLILLGIALMVAEAFSPSFGALGLGGVVAFVIGSVILMDTDLPAYQVAWPVIAAFAVFSALLMVVVVGTLFKLRKTKVVSGLEHLRGSTAVVETLIGGTPYVRLDGELWRVDCEQELAAGDRVEIVGADSLTLAAKKLTGGMS